MEPSSEQGSGGRHLQLRGGHSIAAFLGLDRVRHGHGIGLRAFDILRILF